MSTAAYLLLAFGAVIYLVTMWDVLKTTLSMHGGGPLTTWLMRAIDFAIARTSDKAPQDTPRGLARYSNLALTVALFLLWFLSLLFAATVMLTADPGSVTQVSESNNGAMWLNRLYFVGASLTTAGFGDFVPNGIYWQVLTTLIATSGLVVTSLGISYVVSIVAAVAAQRSLARRITNLGRDPESILAAFYRDGKFEGIGPALEALSGDLVTHTQRHLAYPAIHYVRADDDRDCLPAAIALLDETLTVLLYEAPVETLPPLQQLMTVRRAITAYLESIQSGFVRDLSEEVPAWPDIGFLAEDFGLVPARRERRMADDERRRLTLRRRLVRAGVLSQGLNWERLSDYLETPEEDWLDGDAAALIDSDALTAGRRAVGSRRGGGGAA